MGFIMTTKCTWTRCYRKSVSADLFVTLVQCVKMQCIETTQQHSFFSPSRRTTIMFKLCWNVKFTTFKRRFNDTGRHNYAKTYKRSCSINRVCQKRIGPTPKIFAVFILCTYIMVLSSFN